MTREEARIFSYFKKEDVGKVYEGYRKHYDLICAFAEGYDIEALDEGVWKRQIYPSFSENIEYRSVDPDIDIDKWTPALAEKYYYMGFNGMIVIAIWVDSDEDYNNLDYGNCFKTMDEAENAREIVKKTLLKLTTRKE